MTDWRYIDSFAAVSPTDWIRILPIGKFERMGRSVQVTRQKLEEMVRNFKQGKPGFGVPIKVTHDDTTGKVGNIIDLEVREDGLYGLPDWFPRGLQMLRDKWFQYVSGEVIWGPIDYDNGEKVSNLLVGLALLNDPYFHETALFSIDDLRSANPVKPVSHSESEEAEREDSSALDDADGNESNQTGDVDMDEKTLVEAFASALDRVFGKKAEPTPEPEKLTLPVEETEEYKALQARLEKAEQAREKAERAQAFSDRVEKFRAIVGDELKIGEKDGADLFATIAETHPEEAQALAEQVKALYAQVTEGVLLKELGTSTPEDTADPVAKFTALVEKAKQDGKDEASAIEAVGREHPDLYLAYIKA